MSEVITIRELCDDEWPIYSALRLESLRDCPNFFGGKVDVEEKYSPQEWINWLSPNRQALFGLFDEDMPIGLTGLLVLSEGPSAIHLVASYIRPAYRGRGLSHMLYEARIKWAVKNGAWKKAVTRHREGNEASRRANQKHGFSLARITRETWSDNMVDNRYEYELDLDDLRRNSSEAENISNLLINNRK